MGRFFRNESGYALALTLIMLPAFMGLALLIIDLGRGNNAHSDHAAAADALALAGARELDGGVDAIVRAKAAMEEITNSVSFLGIVGDDVHIDLAYSAETGGDFRVEFLTDIPASDDMPLDPATFIAPENHDTGGANARYVYVYSEARPLHSFFVRALVNFIPSLADEDKDVRVGASAVATYRTGVCETVPMFICNPYEDYEISGTGPDLQTAFAEGDLHGRLFRLIPQSGKESAFPGNFGFLTIPEAGPGASSLREYLAGRQLASCLTEVDVETEPGNMSSLAAGLNTRFDMYDSNFKNDADLYPPAANVRKGYFGETATDPRDVCDASPQPGFPFPAYPTGSVDTELLSAGAAIYRQDWDFSSYWTENHDTALSASAFEGMSSFSGLSPSRYDVYRYEIEENDGDYLDEKGTWPVTQGKKTTTLVERGRPSCYLNNDGDEADISTDRVDDRRVLAVALVDCQAQAEGTAGRDTLRIKAHARIFLASPMDDHIDIEIIDIDGPGGNGTLDAFVRDEAVLVR